MWHQWFNFMELQEYFLCAKKIKIMTSFNSSLPCQSLICLHESITTCMCTEKKKLSNKVIIFVFFAHKKYSHGFITLRLNHWCHMDYFNNILTTFLGLDRVSCCLCRVKKLLDFIKNILICVPKMNEGLTGLEQHFHFWVNSLRNIRHFIYIKHACRHNDINASCYLTAV